MKWHDKLALMGSLTTVKIGVNGNSGEWVGNLEAHIHTKTHMHGIRCEGNDIIEVVDSLWQRITVLEPGELYISSYYGGAKKVRWNGTKFIKYRRRNGE